MAIEARIDASALQDRLKRFSTSAFGMLADRLYSEVGKLAEYIKRDKLSGQILKNRTGNLRNSIFPSISQSTSGPTGSLTGAVSVDNTAPYGRYQEYGAEIPERVPVKAMALRWYVNGSPIFRMRARAFTLPARPFMRPSLDERAPEITRALQQALNQALKK
jgi:HK97 gp10 family phage protein